MTALASVSFDDTPAAEVTYNQDGVAWHFTDGHATVHLSFADTDDASRAIGSLCRGMAPIVGSHSHWWTDVVLHG